VQIGPRYFVTPGKLTGAAAQTCALIETADRTLKVSAFGLDGKTVWADEVISVGGKTKVSVK
jgi:hypothetical protein